MGPPPAERRAPVSLRGAIRFIAVAILALALAPPAPAWNYVTHRVIAAIAYDRLRPAARARVDALIKLHPDYATLFLRDAPANEPGRTRAAFIAASTWADQIRGDPRFYDEGARDVQPTPTLPGFPDMQRHRGWHQIDTPFSQDGTPLQPAPIPNVVTELERLTTQNIRFGTDFERIYNLPWLIHLVGDIHAPLHCVSRFSAEQPKGDLGGNLVIVATGITLHKLWDDAVGTDPSADFVDQTAQQLTQIYSATLGGPSRTSLDPTVWASESLSLSKKEIYTFGLGNGSRDQPLTLPVGYSANAQKVAQVQTVKAGLRLAAVLNQRFK
jgi:hypothetical protein